MFRKSLQIVFVVTTVVGGAVVENLPMLYQFPITISQSRLSYKKEAASSSTIQKNKDSENFISVTVEVEETENSNMVNSDKKNSSNNYKNNNDTNKQIDTTPFSQNVNSDVHTNEKTSAISTPEVKIPTLYYDRTTSIYENDNKTLIRVEYYVNNKLTYYSRVEQFDVTTNSYVEKIYKYNYETNTEILVRTDVYSNGKLVKSY